MDPIQVLIDTVQTSSRDVKFLPFPQCLKKVFDTNQMQLRSKKDSKGLSVDERGLKIGGGKNLKEHYFNNISSIHISGR